MILRDYFVTMFFQYSVTTEIVYRLNLKVRKLIHEWLFCWVSSWMYWKNPQYIKFLTVCISATIALGGNVECFTIKHNRCRLVHCPKATNNWSFSGMCGCSILEIKYIIGILSTWFLHGSLSLWKLVYYDKGRLFYVCDYNLWCQYGCLL